MSSEGAETGPVDGREAGAEDGPNDRRPPASGWTRAERALAASIAIVATLLLFTRLDDRFLWQDEAETALLAESVLREGVPTAFDGRNLISQEGQQESSPPDYRWYWTPWLQHYVTAGAFALLGPSTFSARLPFVLFGLATIALAGLLGARLARDRRVGLFAALLLTTSVPFLLHVRQCRYYALAAFFAVLLVHEYLRLLAGGRRAALGLAVAGAALFHSHYVVFAGCVLGLGLHWLCVARAWARWPALLASAAVTLALALPFLPGFLAHSSGQALPGLDRSLDSLRQAIFHLDRFAFPLVLLVVPLAATAMERRRARRAPRSEVAPPLAPARPAEVGSARSGVALLVLAVVATIVLLVAIMPWFFFRYYVALIPLLAIGQALVVARVWRLRPAAGFVLLVLLAGSDALGRLLPIDPGLPSQSVRHLRTGDETAAEVVGPWARFLPLAAYVHEISHDRTGPIEEAVRVLRERARPGETLIATYGDLPIQFYTDLKVVGGLSGEDPTPHRDAEWLFVRAHTHRAGDARLKRFLSDELDRADYDRIRLPVRDVPYENRPDPIYHKFREPGRGLPPAALWRRRDVADDARGDASTGTPTNESPAD